MLYIVGGCSRSGKSILAGRMGERHGIPWFSLDALKMGLHLGAPSLGIAPDADDLDTADLMWPIVEPILDHAIFDRRDYLVEGVNLRPQTVARLIADTDQPASSAIPISRSRRRRRPWRGTPGRRRTGSIAPEPTMSAAI